MTDKKHIIRTITILVTIVLFFIILAITVDSCKKKNYDYYGDLTDDTYLSLGDNKVTNKELYDYIKSSKVSDYYLVTDKINEEINSLILKDKLTIVDEILESGNNASYDTITQKDLYELLNKKILNDIYSSEEIPESETKRKQAEKKYIDKLLLQGIILENDKIFENEDEINEDYNDKIDEIRFVDTLYDQYKVEAAKQLLALDKLNKEIADKDVEFSLDDVETYYTNNMLDKDIQNAQTVKVLLIPFVSSSEATTILRLLPKGTFSYANTDISYQGLKSSNSKLYPVPAADCDGNECSIEDIKEAYDDYTINSSRAEKYDEDGNLIEHPDVALSIDKVLENFVKMYYYIYSYKGVDITIFDNKSYDEIISLLDEINSDENEINDIKLEYTYEELNDINSSLVTYVFNTLSVENSSQYTSSTRSYGDNQYLLFKLEDQEELDTPDFLDDSNKELYNEIIYELKQKKLTDDYIDEVYNDYLEDVEVSFQDKLLQTIYSLDNKDYEKSTISKENIAFRITYNGENIDVKVSEFFNYCEEKIGPSSAYDLATKKAIKEILYKDESKVKVDNLRESFKDTVKVLIENFTNNNFSYYGYPASIGKENFLKIYFNADSIDDAVDNYYVINKLLQLYSEDYSRYNIDNENILFNQIKEISKKYIDQYYKGSISSLEVYYDRDENNEADDLSEYTSEEINKLNELLEKLYEKIKQAKSTTIDTYIDTLITNYDSSYRMNPNDIYGRDVISVDFDEEIQNSKDWSEYKALGIKIKKNTYTDLTNESVEENEDYSETFKAFIKENITELSNVVLGSEKILTSSLENDNTYGLYYITSVTKLSNFFFDQEDLTDEQIEEYSNINYPDAKLYNESIYNYKEMEGYSSLKYPTLGQIIVYAIESNYDDGAENLPDDLNTNLEAVLSSIMTKVNSTNNNIFLYYQLLISDNNLELNFTNEENEDLFIRALRTNYNTFMDYSENDFYGYYDFLKTIYGEDLLTYIGVNK